MNDDGDAGIDVATQGDPTPAREPEPAAVVDDGEPVTDDAALTAQIEATAVAIPDGERLVPESTLRNVAISYRNKIKEARQGSPDAARLQGELDRANAQIQQIGPLAQAFEAMQRAQAQTQAQQPPPPEDTRELHEIARDFDFYTAAGEPDLDRARRVKDRETRHAEQISQQQVAPLIHRSLQQQAAYNIARAKNTKLGEERADPGLLENLVAQIARQPNGLQTLADPEAMKHLWVNAYGQTQALKALRGGGTARPAAPPVAAAAAPPLVLERSGGGSVGQAKALTTMEKRAAKEAGLSEKAYLEMSKNMPW